MANKYRKISMVLCLSLLSVICLAGCGDNGNPVKLEDTAQQIQGLADYAPYGVLAESFGDDVAYEVTDISWSGEKGTAEVKVTTPDLAKIISESIEKAIDECGVEDYDALLNKVKEHVQKALNSDDCPMMDSVVEMDVRKTDEGYTLISNEEFERIIAGNLEGIFIQTLMEGLANENSN